MSQQMKHLLNNLMQLKSFLKSLFL